MPTARSRSVAAKSRARIAPIAVHSRIVLPPDVEAEVRAALGEKLRVAGTAVERGTVRFDNLGVSKTGVDTTCQIEVLITDHPAVHVEARGSGHTEAFRPALIKITKALARALGRLADGAPRTPAIAGARRPLAKPTRATAALETSTKARPSRKSTRGSANHAKNSQGKERTALAKSLTPSAKATRSHARDMR